MPEYVSSWGRSADEIRRTIRDREHGSSLCALFRVLDFQKLVERNGHVVRVELPGQLCSVLRSLPGCAYAEVLRTAPLSDAIIVGVFERHDSLELAAKSVSVHVFDLDHLRLPCPQLAIARGPLDEVLPSEPTA